MKQTATMPLVRHKKFYHDRSCCLSDYILKIVVVLIMLFVSVITLYPFIYILFYSLSSPGKVGTGLLLYPRGFTFGSYAILLSGSADIGGAMLVSIGKKHARTAAFASCQLDGSVCAFPPQTDRPQRFPYFC